MKLDNGLDRDGVVALDNVLTAPVDHLGRTVGYLDTDKSPGQHESRHEQMGLGRGGTSLRKVRLMYTPPFNRADDERELRDFVAEVRVGWLVTSRAGAAPAASFLPVVWKADTVIAHFAKANAHWREIDDDTPTLLIVTGPDAYVSPSWYAAKAEHGKVVPTWNYSAVHLTGTARVHEDPQWLRAAVTDLTDQHEESRDRPWHVTDAPAAYIEGQLRGIVGVELTVTSATGKAKLSQNRSDADRIGVIDGLRADGRPSDLAVADAMAASLD